MASRASGSPGPIPPDFVMTEYLRALPSHLAEPIALLFALRACMQRVNAGLVQQLGSDALSPGRMQLMMILWASKTAVPQSRLASILAASRASVSELLDPLVRDGLAVAVPDPSHGRRLLVSLTPHGREAAWAQLQQNARRLSEAFATLSGAEQRDLARLLGQLCAS